MKAGDNYIYLNWNSSSYDNGSNITQYNVYRKEIEKRGWLLLEEIPAPQTAYNDTSIEPEKSYQYQVTAVNSVGESNPIVSDIISPPTNGVSWIPLVLLVLFVCLVIWYLVRRR